MLGFQIVMYTVASLLRERLGTLAKDGERGDGGGNALTNVLLAVGGVIAAGLVVAAIAVVVNNSIPKLGGP